MGKLSEKALTTRQRKVLDNLASVTSERGKAGWTYRLYGYGRDFEPVTREVMALEAKGFIQPIWYTGLIGPVVNKA